MHVGIALVSLLAAAVVSLAIFSHRRRRARPLPGGLELNVTADLLLPAGLKHLGARLNEPISLGLRVPNPHAVHGAKRLGMLLPLR